MNPGEALAWLDAHVNLETGVGIPSGVDRRKHAPTLARIRRLVELLGSPQLSYPAIHLTGTNGKTSVARMISDLLVHLGVSAGATTSPHLERVNERIAWDTIPIPDDELARVLTEVAVVEEVLDDRPSYFEVLTATAFSWFADVAVDVAVVEVGLGGRWDATNVVDAAIAAVTNVSIDHVEYLGPTRADIAAEKAGIVKPGATLLLGETDPVLEPLFLAEEPGRVLRADRDFGVVAHRVAHGGRVLTLAAPHRRYDDVFLPLHGAHQADNAALALAAAETFFGRALEPEVVRAAFASVTSPGRLEVLGHQPLLVLDGAHNVAGAGALVRALDDEFAPAPRTYVVGLLREKEPHEMLEALAIRRAERLVCCRPPSPRALDPASVAKAADELGLPAARVAVIDDVGDAVDAARADAGVSGQVIVTGSLYVVGAARRALVSATLV